VIANSGQNLDRTTFGRDEVLDVGASGRVHAASALGQEPQSRSLRVPRVDDRRAGDDVVQRPAPVPQQDAGEPFTQASQLTAARERAQEIDEKLKHEAAPPRQDADWAARTPQNPDDPGWLAAAAMHDAAAMAGMMPGSSVVVLTHHRQPPEPVQAAHRDFPESNPLAASAAAEPPAPKPPPRPAQGPRPGL
jgi:hypothetical protein